MSKGQAKGAKVNRISFSQDDNTLNARETDYGVKIAIVAFQSQFLMQKAAEMNLDKKQLRRLYTFLGNILGVSDG